MKQYVIYKRVSTATQGASGLGLAAQDRDIGIFLDAYTETPFEVVGTFVDVQSGKDDEREQLEAALKAVRETGAELLIAKLDRLSRKVSFIAGLMDDKRVRIRVATMPSADNFQLHIYAALAEQEREFISRRTKAALAEVKARAREEALAEGKTLREAEKCAKASLGGLRDKTMKRNVVVQANAKKRAEKVADTIQPLRKAGKTLREIADALNSSGVKTARGGKWHPAQVQRTLERLDGLRAQSD